VSATADVHVLVIEPDGLVRGTVASVCRQLDIVKVHTAISVVQGEKQLISRTFHGLLISVADGTASLDLLARVRAGEFSCAADLPVAVMSPACDQALAIRLKELAVRRLLLQPFKLRDVIHTVEQLLAARETSAA
jgi:DNA-binding NarL/FixJ family response regulator